MKCLEVDAYFKSVGTWVHWHKTTDIFSFGDGEEEIQKIAVAWKPTFAALKQANAHGANFFISHESIGVRAMNGSMRQDREFMLESESELFDFLETSSLVVYRCHDFLDAVPEWGVMHAWQKGLQLCGRIIAKEYPNIVTEIPPVSVRSLALHVITKTADLGQKSVMLSGNPDKIIHSVATGTGCAHNIQNVRRLKADVSIVVDDAYNSVRLGSHMRDIDYPMIIVNHGVSEEWAVRNLAEHLRTIFPDVEVMYIPQYCAHEFVHENI